MGYDDGHPRGLWRLRKIESLVCGVDGVVRGVHVRVMSKKGFLTTLPLNGNISQPML